MAGANVAVSAQHIHAGDLQRQEEQLSLLDKELREHINQLEAGLQDHKFEVDQVIENMDQAEKE